MVQSMLEPVLPMRMGLRTVSRTRTERPLPGGGAMGAGQLRVYFGAAPGVGKTYKMLEEGHRRLGRGTDVVIGFVETYGRQHTAELIEGLDVIPRADVGYRGTTLEEMDLAAVLRRRPQLSRRACSHQRTGLASRE